MHELKIDRSFVEHIERDEQNLVIARSTVELGHNLGLSVVAEGVETLDALAILKQLGCDEAQGYLFSKPLDCEDFMHWRAAIEQA